MDVSKDIEIACSKDIEQLCSKDMEQAPLKGPVCRFLQKSLIGLDRDKHEKLLGFSPTATSIKLVKALEGLERQGCPIERQGGPIERYCEEQGSRVKILTPIDTLQTPPHTPLRETTIFGCLQAARIVLE